MLVLTRKIGEAIAIGPSIVVRVAAIEGGRVRIGIEAPKNVRVLRQEHFSEEDWAGVLSRANPLACTVQ